MAKPDLNKLKDEIESRKREKSVAPQGMGEQSHIGASPRDTFLYGLMESLKTGRDTASTNLIKIVENKTAAKHGEIAKHVVNEVAPVQHPIQREQIDMSPEREEQMFFDLEKKRKQTIAESMQEYIKTPQIGTPMNNNPAVGGRTAPILNEAYLVENVKKVVDGYLAENLAPIFEEAIKSTIIEMYAVERIKEVLHENREMIKTVVIETIREIQAKNKAKAQS